MSTSTPISETNIQVGDHVRVMHPFLEGYVGEINETIFYVWHNNEHYDGSTGRINQSTAGYKYSWSISKGDNGYIEIIKRGSANKTSMTSIKEKFALIFKSEPQKSFQKAEITDSNDTLTEEGQVVFLSWLLKKNGDDFKKEIVDPILAEDAKEESK